MNTDNKETLLKANDAIIAGDNEGFLHYCTDDVKWTFIGDKTLKGKEAVRQYLATAYKEPPKFRIENLLVDGDFLIAIGDISMKNETGKMIDYKYCDVWLFREGKMAELKAFVIGI